MKKTEFLQALRSGNQRFRIDNVSITTDAGKLTGSGILETKNDTFNISVILRDCVAPDIPNGIKLRNEFWRIEGMLEDEIPFTFDGLPSGTSHNYTFGLADRSSVNFSVNRLDLSPLGYDTWTRRQTQALHASLNGNRSAPASIEESSTALLSKPDAEKIEVTFHAVLPEFKLLAHNGGTKTTEQNDFLGEIPSSRFDTFHGKLDEWEYGLVERDGDLHVYLNSTPLFESESDTQDQKAFHAFLQTVAFTHGQHAWPFTMKYRRDGKLTLDRVQLNGTVAHSHHAPFTHRLAFNARSEQIAWDFHNALELVFRFFSTNSKIAQECENLMFLFREATSPRIPHRITLLSLCSLLESLVRVIYEEQIQPSKTRETAGFEALKKEVCDQLRSGNPTAAHQRLRSIILPLDSVNIRMRFEAVFEHLNLKPSSYWTDLHELWRTYRNPMSHRISKSSSDESSFKDDVVAESRLAGAINCIVLKLMGYSGLVRRSAYEDDYARI